MQTSVLLLGLLFLLIFMGVPIGYSMGITAMVTLKFLHPGIPLVIVPQRMFGGANNFILLCIPFFMLAGSLMSLTPLFNKIIVRRGCRRPYSRRSPCEYCLSMFSWHTGAAVADTAAVGSLLIPARSRRVTRKLCNGGDSDVVDYRCDYSSQQRWWLRPRFKHFGASLVFGDFIPGVLSGLAQLAVSPKDQRITKRESMTGSKSEFSGRRSP